MYPGAWGTVAGLSLRFVLNYPETTGADGDALDAGPVGEIAAAAEAAGFDGFATSEHPAPSARWLAAGGHQTLDPFVALSFAAACTTRLRLVTYLAVAPYRNPFLLAKAAATLDRLSDGRLILGLGAGYQKAEFRALGADFDERNAIVDEVLDILPLAWSGEPVTFEGRHFSARDVVALPRPAQRPIPIWLGGNGRLLRERVAARADGWMPLLGSPELLRTTRTPGLGSIDDLAGHIAGVRRAAGGRPVDVLVSHRDPALADPDHDADPDRDADRHRAAFAAYERAGVTWLAVSAPAVSRERTLAFVETFGRTHLHP